MGCTSCKIANKSDKLQNFTTNFYYRLQWLQNANISGGNASDAELLALRQEMENFLREMEDFYAFAENNNKNTKEIERRLDLLITQSKKLNDVLWNIEQQM